MSQDTFYITTPIYYVNAVPHIGNAYTTIACDVLARFNRQIGNDVLFATGTDEHALKVAEVAQAKGMDTKPYADTMEPLFKEQWAALNISFDDYIRTPEERHVRCVQEAWKRMEANGDIYLGSYEGWYCVSDETFFTKAEAPDGHCPNPECRKELSWVQEENYFFKLSAYQDRLLEYMQTNPGWLSPDYRANEVISFTKGGLKDQSISRVNNGWGIPVPGNEKHVIYVWFDALLNYLTVAGFPDNQEKMDKYWPPDIQMMGKDIFVRFHCTLWPAMLMSLGVPLTERFFGHGFWTVEGEKISKSKGNAVYATDLVEEVSSISGCTTEVAADAVRYFMLREVPFGLDGDFSRQALTQRFNTDLANDVGNLLNRTLAMLHKWFGGVVPQHSTLDAGLSEASSKAVADYRTMISDLQFGKAYEAVWALVSSGNKYIEQSAPWALHREGKEEELATVLYNALETARVVTTLIAPVMPNASRTMWNQLGLEGSPLDFALDASSSFGGLPVGTKTGNADPVFPRIQTKPQTSETVQKKKMETQKPVASSDTNNIITIDDFKKVQLKAAKIVNAERIDGADKLLKLTVDAGEEAPRTIVAGIAQFYGIEDLPGKSIVIVANLAPAKLRGVESNGMVLAADTDGKAILLTPESEAPPGSTVR